MSSSTSQPTTRSRTLLFISYRDSRARSSRFSRANSYDDPDIGANENERLMSSQPAHVSLDVDLPPKWYPLLRLYHTDLLLIPCCPVGLTCPTRYRTSSEEHMPRVSHSEVDMSACSSSTLKLFVHFLQLRH
jgi:hypothetical protein